MQTKVLKKKMVKKKKLQKRIVKLKKKDLKRLLHVFLLL